LLGDCREILPQLDVRDYFPHLTENKVDLVLTDPPYPDWHIETYKQTGIEILSNLICRQLVFWSVRESFPLDYSSIHIWDKYPAGQNSGVQGYERIFERNGRGDYRIFRGFVISNKVRAMRSADIFTGHPSQKPRHLIEKLIVYSSDEGGLILDPFLGSGTTCYCAKKLNRYSIGVEIEEKYCEIAAKRCCQEVMELKI